MKAGFYFLIVFIGLCTVSSAQVIKYRDFIPKLEGLSPEEQKNQLKEYIIDDLDHPNANFRLALLYERAYKLADPLTEFDKTMANATQAKIRFFKSSQVIDQREVERNNEYYSSIYNALDGKSFPIIEPGDILNKIKGGHDSSTLWLAKLPVIYSSFTKTVFFYDHCVKAYAAINQEFRSMEDLYLLYDATLDARLSKLKQDFDSTLFFFDRYIGLTKAFPLPYHRQHYSIQPINQYRLDGLLTQMNFLVDQVVLWDYSRWAEEVKKWYNGEIIALRKRVQTAEEQVNATLSRVNSSTAPAAVTFKLDKQLAHSLINYDRESLALALLEYKSFKCEWLAKATFRPDSAAFEKNAEQFSDLIYLNRTADTLLTKVEERSGPEQIKKNNDFVSQYYKGAEGLKEFVIAERKFIRQSDGEYLRLLQENLTGIAELVNVSAAEKTVKSGKYTISFSVKPITPEVLDAGIPITLVSRKSPDGSVYLGGVYKPDKKKTATWILRVAADGKPAWFKSIALSIDSLAKGDAHNMLGPLVLTQEGCAFMVRLSHITRTDKLNYFVYLNDKGEEKLKTKIRDRNYPRGLLFAEKTNTFAMVLKGTEETQRYDIPEPMVLLDYNSLGDMLWKKEIALAGTVEEFVQVADGFALGGNYTLIKDTGGKEYKTNAAAHESNPFFMKVSEKGDIVKILPFLTGRSVCITRLIKVNDRSLNLLGYDDHLNTFRSGSQNERGRVFHALLDYSGKVISSTK